MKSILRERFRDQVERYLLDYPVGKNRARVRCIFHQDRVPSLSIDLEKAVFYCHGCGVGGGAKDFAQLVGEKWSYPRSDSHIEKAHRAALATAHDQFRNWQRRKLVALTDEYREAVLEQELEIAEIAYRQIQRRPDLYTLDDAMWWVGQLYAIRERLASQEYQLDILTYEKYRVERIRWWLAEEEEEVANGA